MAKKPKIEASSVGVAVEVVKASAPSILESAVTSDSPQFFDSDEWRALRAQGEALGIDPVILAMTADPDRKRRWSEEKAQMAARPIEETISYQRQQHYRRQIVFSFTIPIFKWKLSIEMRQRNPEPFKNPLV